MNYLELLRRRALRVEAKFRRGYYRQKRKRVKAKARAIRWLRLAGLM